MNEYVRLQNSVKKITCPLDKKTFKELGYKISTNIQDLFDEIVVWQPWTNSYYITDSFECIKVNLELDYYKSVGYEDPIIYGAIWTPKGLIFVACFRLGKGFELL